jgi:hypothetical protein
MRLAESTGRRAVTVVLMALAVIAVAPRAVMAGSLSPSSVSATLGVGETTHVTKTVTTDATGTSRVDIFFLADNTGSMGGVIANVQASAAALLSGLGSAFSDPAFGVGRYLGDPIEFGSLATNHGPSAYQNLQPITTNTANVTTAINAWFASGGGDIPEANFFALHQVATQGAAVNGQSTTPGTGWRSGAARVVVWYGDASAHQETINQANTITALVNNGVEVVALNSSGSGSGIDTGGQSNAIVTATGGALVNNFTSLSSAAQLAAVLAAIGTVTSTLDLSLAIGSGDTSGLGIGFSCVDPSGCTGVPGGASRLFDMSITGLLPGTYDFTVLATGVAGAIETDHIVVGGTTVPPGVPNPMTLLLLGSGIVGMVSLSAWRARN